MEKIIDVWSDNWHADEVINIIHDYGYTTAGMTRETIGVYAENVEWTRCKDGELPSMCVGLTHDEDTFIHGVDEIEEKPLFLYKLVLIVPDMPKAEESEEDTMEDKKTNVVMNIGMTTKDGVHLEIESAMDAIGNETDCTITKCIGFYKGRKEASLKVEIYGIVVDRAVSMASYFSHIFRQECVAVSVGSATVFVNDNYTEDEFIAWCEELDR